MDDQPGPFTCAVCGALLQSWDCIRSHFRNIHHVDARRLDATDPEDYPAHGLATIILPPEQED